MVRPGARLGSELGSKASRLRPPVRRERSPNSRSSVPAAAVHVTGVSVGLTPRRRLIDPKGMPDSVC